MESPKSLRLLLRCSSLILRLYNLQVLRVQTFFRCRETMQWLQALVMMLMAGVMALSCARRPREAKNGNVQRPFLKALPR